MEERGGRERGREGNEEKEERGREKKKVLTNYCCRYVKRFLTPNMAKAFGYLPFSSPLFLCFPSIPIHPFSSLLIPSHPFSSLLIPSHPFSSLSIFHLFLYFLDQTADISSYSMLMLNLCNLSILSCISKFMMRLI